MEPKLETITNEAGETIGVDRHNAASDLEKISQQVKQRVFGQDEHIDKILRFINVALTRNSFIQGGRGRRLSASNLIDAAGCSNGIRQNTHHQNDCQSARNAPSCNRCQHAHRRRLAGEQHFF